MYIHVSIYDPTKVPSHIPIPVPRMKGNTENMGAGYLKGYKAHLKLQKPSRASEKRTMRRMAVVEKEEKTLWWIHMLEG